MCRKARIFRLQSSFGRFETVHRNCVSKFFHRPFIIPQFLGVVKSTKARCLSAVGGVGLKKIGFGNLLRTHFVTRGHAVPVGKNTSIILPPQLRSTLFFQAERQSFHLLSYFTLALHYGFRCLLTHLVFRQLPVFKIVSAPALPPGLVSLSPRKSKSALTA